MRVLVVGAYGLLGGHVTARLLADGHQVVGVGRDLAAAARRFPGVAWVRADLRLTSREQWIAHLAGMDAVVNCAGALQDGPRDDLRAVHVATVDALASACEATGVRRFVHISAVGVGRGVGAFLSTKKAADEALQRSSLDWIILRPGLVIAPVAYGGSALLRGLAGFPLAIPATNAESRIQTVSVTDVAEAVIRSLVVERTRFICDLVARESTTLADLLRALRAWLGFAPVRLVTVPAWWGAIAAAGADLLGRLGWRSPMRTAALEQLAAGVEGRAEDAQMHLGFTPASLSQTLAAWPSGVQERWFARLYLMKPLLVATLAAFWAASGAIGLARHENATALLMAAGLPQMLSAAAVYGGSAVDLILAVLSCVRATARVAFVGMITVTAAYLVSASVWVPALWSDPLGPLVKSVPAAVLALVALAILDER
jgi:uncharacterized protein YbjT (DUF2867 family)